MPTAKKPTRKRSTKGKRHVAHAASFHNVAARLREHASNPLVDLSEPRALLRLVADAMASEGKRVQKIVR